MFEKYITKTGRLSCKQPQELKNQWYIQKFQEVHEKTYDYSRVEYTGAKDKVLIACRQHGGFLQTPSDHLQGKGCPKCTNRCKKPNTEAIADFQYVHGDQYDYSKVDYQGDGEYVVIICNTHGSFSQTPSNHIQGKGCPKCQHKNHDTVYLLRCQNTGLIKIGITNHLGRRIGEIGGQLSIVHTYSSDNPRQVEKALHQLYASFRTYNNTVKNGNTEFFNLSSQHIAEIVRYLEGL